MIATYRALALAQLQALSQYRAQVFIYLFFSIIRPVIFLAAWVAVANSQGGRVGAFGVADFAAYYVGIMLVGHLTMFWHAWDFETEVRLGKLSAKLLRPLHPVHYAVVENATWKLYTLLGLAPAIVLIALTFGARFTTDLPHLLLFMPSVLLAAALNFVIGWCVCASAFWTTRVHAVAELVNRAAFIFAGTIAPLDLLPGVLRTIAYALPFGYVIGVPAEILRGGTSLERAVVLLAVQATWLLIALLAFRMLWATGLRRYSAVGA
ncbi:MAG TPA: ABC-2 family transporter protein [Candidatus Dormibacteraeota bacterium]|nr:ABC-2 family transporter protein [Candidatus Dormibacteraeota bacterium]